MKKLVFCFGLLMAMMACTGNSTSVSNDTVDTVDSVLTDSVDSVR